MPLTRVQHRAVIAFGRARAAEAMIAGLPAAARAVREAALAGVRECWLDAGPGWIPSDMVRTEVDRLRGAMVVRFPGEVRGQPQSGPLLLVAGEMQPTARQLAAAGEDDAQGIAFVADAGDAGARTRLLHGSAAETRRRYARLGRAILAATTKPTDGLVSRHINRPLSQAITRQLLRIPGFRPFHATLGTAALAALMFAALTMFGEPGLLVGALLFQAASMFDGVDGEAARSTFRASDRGAMFDSLVDALTNLFFVLGLVVNMHVRGHVEAASFGVCGLLLLAAGLTIIGRRARANAGPFTFDGVKDRMRARGTRLGQWLVWLTMRDFLAFASVVLVLMGWAEPALMAFSGVMAGWLVVVIAIGARQSAAAR
ncbi:MAG: CDP-alcohol phosphatidyltransferase family protein [Sphingomonadales bacterium]|nr:CDP-alcohol phosphatidyltransferase family protein [Sphingomonadales bacterium]